MRFIGVILALILAWAVPATAQTTASPQILTIDLDTVFTNSAFGKRVTDELRQRSEALAAENRGIESQLEIDEKALTDQRAGMTTEAFRTAAADFDVRVQQIRSEQDGKQQALQTFQGDARTAFLSAIQPVLTQILQDRGALVLVDRRAVFLAASSIDITDVAIVAIDKAIGDGADLIPATAPTDPAAAPAS